MSRKPNLATHFFVEPHQITGNNCSFSREESDHILKTFRLYIGDLIKATDGTGNLFDVKLSAYNNKTVTGEIVKTTRFANELNTEITIAFGLALQAKTDQIIEQCTQLGVRGFVPLTTKFSQVKLTDEKSDVKLSRWRKVAISAMKQSLRSLLPEISAPLEVDSLATTLKTYDLVLLGSLKGKSLDPLQLKNSSKILLITGPEQGFSRIEEDSLISAGAVSISLGDRRLRAELAPVVMTTMVLTHLGLN